MQRLIVTSATYRQASQVSAGTAGKGSGEPPAGARPALPAARRDGPRQRAGRQRPAEREDRRAERVSLSAAGTLGGALARRDLHRAGIPREPGRATSTAAACTPSGSAPCRPPRSPPSTRPIARSAPRAGSSPTRRCRRWCCSTIRLTWKPRACWRSARSWKPGRDPQARVRFLFREATARRPSPAEVRVLLDLAQRRLEHYKKQPALAAQTDRHRRIASRPMWRPPNWPPGPWWPARSSTSTRPITKE